MERPGRAEELCITVGEDASVGGHQPVARSVRGRSHAHDGFVQVERPGRAVEMRIAVGEDPSVGGHQPVARSVRGRSHAHDGLVQVERPGRAEEMRVAVGEDATVGGHQPVALPIRRRGHRNDGLVERPAHTAEVGSSAIWDDAAGRVGEPVSLNRVRRHQASVAVVSRSRIGRSRGRCPCGVTNSQRHQHRHENEYGGDQDCQLAMNRARRLPAHRGGIGPDRISAERSGHFLGMNCASQR